MVMITSWLCSPVQSTRRKSGLFSASVAMLKLMTAMDGDPLVGRTRRLARAVVLRRTTGTAGPARPRPRLVLGVIIVAVSGEACPLLPDGAQPDQAGADQHGRRAGRCRGQRQQREPAGGRQHR